MSRDRRLIGQQFRVYGPAGILVVIAFVLAYQFIKPAPPSHIVMSTGTVDGAYHAYAERYAAILARQGIRLELRSSAGSVENLARLGAGEVDVALVQGGVAPMLDGIEPHSLGSLYYEPLWIFHRTGQELNRLKGLAGLRLAVGPEGSGTRVLAAQLLKDNGVHATWLSLGGEAAADALLAGDVDAAFFVISAQSSLVGRLLREPQLKLMDFSRALAYARRYPFLSALELPEGVVDLADNIPGQPVRLLAPAANLVVQPDLHPALAGLLLQAATEVHRDGGWFEQRDEFPQPDLLAFPLSPEADRFYQYGPPFLQRFLPFWAASLVDRLKIMLVPLLMLLFPLIKVMPPIYTWRMRARVYRWYDQLEGAERALMGGKWELGRFQAELDRIESDVQQVKVPLSFSDQVYHLRQHIELVRKQRQPGP